MLGDHRLRRFRPTLDGEDEARQVDRGRPEPGCSLLRVPVPGTGALVERARGHAERLEDELGGHVRKRCAGDVPDEQLDECVAAARIDERRAGRPLVADGRSARGWLAVEHLHERGQCLPVPVAGKERTAEAGRVAEQMAQRHTLAVRELPGGEPLVDVRVEVDGVSSDEAQGRQRRDRLRHRARLKALVLCALDADDLEPVDDCEVHSAVSGSSRMPMIGDGSSQRTPRIAPTVAIHRVSRTPIAAPSNPPASAPSGRTP